MTSKTSVVHSDPEILGGTPVFVGTRVPAQTLFDYLEGGETLDEFLHQFPSVKREQALAALVTMDTKLPRQQNLATQPFGVVLVEAPSNRMLHLRPLVPDIRAALDGIRPGGLRRVGA